MRRCSLGRSWPWRLRWRLVWRVHLRMGEAFHHTKQLVYACGDRLEIATRRWRWRLVGLVLGLLL